MSNQPIKVLKASGEYEPFSEKKVRSSLKRAGADRKLIEKIINHVKGELYDGISTKKIYAHVFKLLRKLESPLASKYNLKQAIMELGPSGYPFEKFIGGILANKGYLVEVDRVIEGKCVSHEIDVMAQKGTELFLVECKFRNRPGTKLDLKIALYTYARFLDAAKTEVEIGGKRDKFHQAWLVTNTKVTTEFKKYAKCVDLKVTSWDYPADASLRLLIEKSGLHPVTCLSSLSRSNKRALLEAGIVFCQDLVDQKIDFLPADLVRRAKKEISAIYEAKKLS